MSKSVGKSVTRVDAYEKATGRAKYTADLCDQKRPGGQDPARHHRPRLREVHRHCGGGGRFPAW